MAERVIAVDLDPRMLAVLGRRLGPVPRSAGRGEMLPLRSGSADAVVIASAWHWLDHALAWPEKAPVIRPGGTFSVVASGIDRSVEWVADLLAVPPPGGGTARDGDGERRRERWPAELAPGGLFADAEERTFTASVPWAVEDLPRLVASYSRLLVLPEAERRAQMAEVAVRSSRRAQLAGRKTVDLPIRAVGWRAIRTGARPGSTG